MITIFNRKELIITMDMGMQMNVRDVLSANKIDYVIKTKNLYCASFAGSRRSYVGSFGTDSNYMYEYKIYVRKCDFDKAKYLTNQLR